MDGRLAGGICLGFYHSSYFSFPKKIYCRFYRDASVYRFNGRSPAFLSLAVPFNAVLETHDRAVWRFFCLRDLGHMGIWRFQRYRFVLVGAVIFSVASNPSGKFIQKEVV